MKTLYSTDHEYVKIDGDIATVGITDYAQSALGDVVYVELPKLGTNLQKGAQAGVVESVKSASEIYAPLSGEVVEINDAITADTALVNQDAEGGAWFFKIRVLNMDETSDLKDAEAYKAFTQGL